MTDYFGTTLPLVICSIFTLQVFSSIPLNPIQVYATKVTLFSSVFTRGGRGKTQWIQNQHKVTFVGSKNQMAYFYNMCEGKYAEPLVHPFDEGIDHGAEQIERKNSPIVFRYLS